MYSRIRAGRRSKSGKARRITLSRTLPDPVSSFGTGMFSPVVPAVRHLVLLPRTCAPSLKFKAPNVGLEKGSTHQAPGNAEEEPGSAVQKQ